MPIVYCFLCVVSQWGQVLDDKNSLASPRVTDVPAQILESGKTYIECLRDIGFAFSYDLPSGLSNSSDSVVILVFFKFILDIVVLIQWTS